MRKQTIVPVRANVIDKNGNLSVQWRNWFQQVGVSLDKRRKVPDLEYAEDKTLTTDDYGKTITFDCTDAERVCTLMTTRQQDVHGWITIVRRGTNRLTIIPDNSAGIEYGTPGGRLWNNEAKRFAANVTLQLVSITQWGITGATGVWNVR